MLRHTSGRKAVRFDALEGDGDIEEWIHGWSPVAEVRPIFGPDGYARFDGSVWQVGELLVNRFDLTGQILNRKPDHLGLCSELVSIQRLVKGSGRGEIALLAFEQTARIFTVLDWAFPYTNVHSEGRIEGIMVPKALIGLEEGAAAPLRIIDALQGEGRVLAMTLTRLLDTLETREPHAADAEPLLQLLRCLLAPERATRTDRKGVSNARYLAIKSYIENRLGDCDLSVASILNTFALTRRSLYRYFEPSGGVRAYIQSRRLARALTDLAAQPYSRGRVAAAARCWGFSSEAAFSRAVRREFGAPPGRLFDRSVAPGYRPHFPRSIDEWLKPPAS